MRARRWCFTLNNPTAEEKASIAEFGPNAKYLVVGREVGEGGTPHLQGYVEFANYTSLAVLKQVLGTNRLHAEIARGTPKQASEYCKKEHDFDEYGSISAQGKRNDWEEYKEFVLSLGRVPTKREIVAHNTTLWARFPHACQEIAALVLPPPAFVPEGTNPRLGFQTRVIGRMESPTPNPRTIDFIVDQEGNSGKSWICQYALTNHPDAVQVLSVGKRDDVTYVLDTNKRIFLFDVPRGQMQFFRYEVLEMLKNRIIHSNKYQATVKTLANVPYVAVFSNEHPDMQAISADRYNIIEVTNENRGH